MKYLLLIVISCLCSHVVYSQAICLGEEKNYIRQIQKQAGNTFIESTIANSGNLIDVYGFNGSKNPQLIFYYDRNDTCRKYKIMMVRESAPDFIEHLKTQYRKIGDKDWISNNNDVGIMMNIDDNNIVEFTFELVSDLKKGIY